MKKLVDDCVSSQYSGSLRPHDAVSALGPMYDVHDKNHLPRMEACDRELQNLLEYCKKSKNTMNLCVHTRLQTVAALQSNIRDMRNQLAVFKEAMSRQDDIFTELKLLRRVGPAYKACLAEVVRRKACMKLYMGQVVVSLFHLFRTFALSVITGLDASRLDSTVPGLQNVLYSPLYSHPDWSKPVSSRLSEGGKSHGRGISSSAKPRTMLTPYSH